MALPSAVKPSVGTTRRLGSKPVVAAVSNVPPPGQTRPITPNRTPTGHVGPSNTSQAAGVSTAGTTPNRTTTGHVGPSNTSAAAGAAGSAFNPDGSVKPGREGEVGRGPLTSGVTDKIQQKAITPMAPGVGPGVSQPQFEGLDMTQYGPLEDLWREKGAEFFNGTNTQAWYDMVAPGLQAPGAGTNFYNENQGFYQTPGFGETVNQEVSNSLQGPSQTAGYWDENGQFVATPGMGENYAGQALGKYANGTPDVSNLTFEAYQDFLKSRPDIKDDAGLEGYYDYAKQRGSESLNRELAARGVYGSGRGLDKLGDMFGGLEAEMANRQADYYLRAMAEDRAWAGLGLQGSVNADLSSLRQSENERAWMSGLGDLAFQGQGAGMQRWLAGLQGAGAADSADLARAGMRAGTATNAQNMGMDRMNALGDLAFRSGDEDLRRTMAGADMAGLADNTNLNFLNSGFNAAGATQNAERQRGQDYFNNTFATSGAFSDMFGGAYGDIIGNDQSLFDSWAGALLGYDTEALSLEQRAEAEAAAKAQAQKDALRNLAWAGGTALAPTTGGWSMAAPLAYEGLNYAGYFE